jgi:hypothetical protein
MSIGTFILRRFIGDEIYQLQSATINIAAVDDGVEVTFTARAAPGALQALPDTAQFPATPHVEARAFLSWWDAHMLVGQRFLIPTGYDDQRDEHVATIYYYEYEDLDNTMIEVLAQADVGVRVSWRATTQDVNYYDGSKPTAEVIIEGIFSVAPYQQDRF